MRILTFSSLFPSQARPRHGIFVETRLRELVASGEVQSRVVCPVPWFPFARGPFGEWCDYARVARREQRHGLDVVYPRFPLLPKVGMTLAPRLMAAWMRPVVQRIVDDGYDFDLIDAHYFYPDGVAAMALGRAFRRPVVITARGTDVNLIPQYPAPRRMIQQTARECAAMITVSRPLKEALVALGADERRVTVARNGVDLQRFTPAGRTLTRKELGLDGVVLLSVGNLVEGKGHHIAIESLAHLSDAKLIIVGEGGEERTLRRLAAGCGVTDRVRFIGNLPQAVLAGYYAAADVLLLCSSREGTPNVVLEAIACGTPVVATKVGGIPDVLSTASCGVLMAERSVAACVDGVRQLLASLPDRSATRACARQFDWAATTSTQLRVFRDAISRHSNGASVPSG